MRQNRYRHALSEQAIHYKLYKAKKNWVIAGITLFGFGLGAASTLPATTVAAATVTTTSTDKPATTSAASRHTAAVANVSKAATTKNSAAAASSATSSAAVTSVSASVAKTKSATPQSATSSATAASTSKNENAIAKAATPASHAASSAASAAADKATSTATQDTQAASPVATSAAPQLKTPPVKSGITPTASIALTTAGGSNKVTSSPTNFTVNFTGAANDVVTIRIDGVDVSDTLYPGSSTSYTSISNVTKAPAGVTTTVINTNVTDATNKKGAVVDTITIDGSYSQSFDLTASSSQIFDPIASSLIYYSPTTTAVTTETGTKKIQVYINGALATSMDYTIDYKVIPVRLLPSSYYDGLGIYSADPVSFVLPEFGASSGSSPTTSPTSLIADDLKLLNAKTVEYRVPMPAGFVLDEAATAKLVSSYGVTVTQDTSNGDVVVTYKDVSKAVNDMIKLFIQGTFTDYVAGTSVTVDQPNTLTVVTNDDQTLTSQSPQNNVIKYLNPADKDGEYLIADMRDYNESDGANIYVDLQRAKATNDSFTITSGMVDYTGPAASNMNSMVKVPAGLTTKALTVSVDDNMLTNLGVTTLPYQVTYTDGSKDNGTLIVGTNTIPLKPGKILQEMDYQFVMPAMPDVEITSGGDEPITQVATSASETPSFSLPLATLTLGIDDNTTVGDYKITSQITGKDANNTPIIFTGGQTVKVIDGQTNAYLSLGTVSAQTQTSTSAGEILTADTSVYGVSYIHGTDGVTLSNGNTSKSTDVVANFINKPIFYFVAPKNTHFAVDTTVLAKNIPGIKLTSYQTTAGQQAYKIDLSQATSQDFSNVEIDSYRYSYSQPIAATGVFPVNIFGRLINAFEIQADPDAVAGSDTLKIYYTNQDQVNDVSNGFDTDGALTGDANAIAIELGDNTYTIKNMSGIFGLTMVQGSNDNGYSNQGTSNVYQPLANNELALNIENIETTPLNNVSELVNLPTVGDDFGSEFNVQLAGAATSVPAGVTVLYSTRAQAQQTAVGAHPDGTGYVPANQVSDWSAIKSILIQTPTLAAGASLGRVIFNVADPTQVADVNKTAYFDSGTYADDLTPLILDKTMATNMTIKGSATINYAFLLPDGTKVAAPGLAQVVTVGTDTIPLPTVKATDLPTGYRLIDANGQAITSVADQTGYQVGTVVNSTADYSSLNGDNTVAQVGTVATYAADGDTVLIPVVDTTVQKMQYKYIDDTTVKNLETTHLTGTSLTPTTATTTDMITSYQNQGYVLVSDETNGQTMVFDNDAATDQVYEIHFKHGTTVATTTTPGQPGTPIGKTATNWPNASGAQNLSRTVTQTIHYVYRDGTLAAPEHTQKVTFQQAVVVDQVTGAVLGYLAPDRVAAYQTDPTSVTLAADNAWTVTAGNADFKSVPSPAAKAGYGPGLVKATAAYTVTPTTDNEDLTVTYVPDAQKASVTYVDADNGDQVLQIDQLAGVTASTQDYTPDHQTVQAAYEKLGYVYDHATGNALNANNVVTFDNDTKTDQVTTIYLKHKTTTVTPDQPQTPGEPLLTTPNQWPNASGAQNLSRTVTQTIHYVYRDGTLAAPEHTQKVTFQQAVVVDQVTGAVLGYLAPDRVAAYQADPTSVTLAADNAWTVTAGNADFKDVASPAAKVGYTPDVATTATYQVTPDTGSADLTVTYTADVQKATVTYVDLDNENQVLQTDQLAGVAGSTLVYAKVRQAIQSGYEKLGYVYDHETGNALAANDVVTFDTDAKTDQATTIYLKHSHLTVTPDQPQMPATPLPNTPDPKHPNDWPAGVNTLDLNRKVTATAQFIYSTGGKVGPDQTQTVTFSRDAIVDGVTGTLLGYLTPDQVAAYQADPTSVDLTSTGGWDQTKVATDFTLPTAKPGYTPDLKQMATADLTPTSGNLKLTVTYTPDTQTATIQYVDLDAHNTILQSKAISGASNSTLDYAKVRQAIESGYAKLGYVVDHTDLPANGLTFDNDKQTAQTATIYLKHGTVPVMPNDPQTPGDTMPNATTKWPNGVSAQALQRTVTETVHYVYADGSKAGADQHQTVTFQRAVLVDAVTGAVRGYLTPDQVAAYQADPASVTLTPTGGWNHERVTLPAITSPAVKAGATADLVATKAYTVTPTSGDLTLTVTYTLETPAGTTTGEPGTPVETVTDKPGTPPDTTTDEPGTPVETVTDEPSTPTDTTTDEPGMPVETVTDEPSTPTDTTTDEPGTPVETVTDEPSTPTDTTTDEPGTPVDTTTDKPGMPVETVTDEPSTPTDTVMDEPGTPTDTTTDEPNTPTDEPTTSAEAPSLAVGPATDTAKVPMAKTTGNPTTPVQKLATPQPTVPAQAAGKTTSKVAATKATQATLPQTGTADDAGLATLGLTVLGSIGLLGAAELRKRQGDDFYEV